MLSAFITLIGDIFAAIAGSLMENNREKK